MNETLGRGYARIEAIRAARGELGVASESGEPPPDRFNYVYMTMIVTGAAFFVPYNTFIMAVDYFQSRYPDSSIIFDMSTVYISSACVAVVANNLLLDIFGYCTRIKFGFVLTLTTLLFVALCNICWHVFSDEMSYTVNLVAIGLIAFGCTVQQASFYGFSSCLPPRYTQAVMAGESVAGLWASLDRIITKNELKDPTWSVVAFFLGNIMIIMMHCFSFYMLMKHPFVEYYVKLLSEARNRRRVQLFLNANEDITLMDNETSDSNYGVLKLQSPALSTGTAGDVESSAFSFANPVYSPTAPAPSPAPSPAPTPRPSFKVDEILYDRPKRSTCKSWQAFKRGVLVRWVVARGIYPYMVSIGLVYFTTLSVYPGISSEVMSCQLGTWMPIVLMTSFNIFDLMGKIAAAWPYEWSRSQLLMASGVRLLLVPLMLLCAAPRHAPHIVGDIYPIMFSIILGFSNGLFGSVPMIMAPSRVATEHREIAGNVMTLSYNGGLLSGSMVSYLLLSMLGPPASSICRVYPTPTLLILTTTTTAASLPTTAAVNVTYLTLNI